MKRFLGFLVLILVGLSMSVAITGGVIAVASSYSVMSGEVEVTVLEPLELSNITVSQGSYESNVWDLQLYAGVDGWLETTLTNLASVSIPAMVTTTPVDDCDGGVSAIWTYHDGFIWTPLPAPKTFAPGNSTDLRLIVSVNASCPIPCNPIVTFAVER